MIGEEITVCVRDKEIQVEKRRVELAET